MQEKEAVRRLESAFKATMENQLLAMQGFKENLRRLGP